MGIVNLSETDLDPSIIIEAWLAKQENSDGIRFLMDDFHRSVDYVEKLKDKSAMASKVGLIRTGLEFVTNCTNKEQFCVGLARGLGSTLRQVERNAFCLNVSRKLLERLLLPPSVVNPQLFESADIYVPNKHEADLCTYNAFQNKIDYYSTDHTSDSDQTNKPGHLLIRTGHMKMYADVVRQFIKNQKNLPFVIVGPSGCGRR